MAHLDKYIQPSFGRWYCVLLVQRSLEILIIYIVLLWWWTALVEGLLGWRYTMFE